MPPCNILYILVLELLDHCQGQTPRIIKLVEITLYPQIMQTYQSHDIIY